MTEQELRERIASKIFSDKGWKYTKDWKAFDEKDTAVNLLADQILALTKEAGYVKLAEDQTLPSVAYAMDLRTMINMKGLGWQKVELEAKDGS